jgi:hypothetical protein
VRAAVLFFVATAGLAPECSAEVFTCTDAHGRTVFQDIPCGTVRRPPAEVRIGKSSGSSAAIDGAAKQPLERSQVQGVLRRLHQAMTKRDTKAVVALLAGDVEVQWVFTKGQPGEPALDRSAYADYLRQVFGRPDYVYERKSERMALAKRNARATVTRSLRESVLVKGRLQVADVDERLTIEPDGRKLVVRAVRKTAVLEGRSGAAASSGLPSRLGPGQQGGLAFALLAQDDQDDQDDEPGGHRDIQH